MQTFVADLVKSLVDFPDDVQVSKTASDQGVFLTLTVNPADMGKVIGKKGRTIKALRDLVRIKATKNRERVTLTLAESASGPASEPAGEPPA